MDALYSAEKPMITVNIIVLIEPLVHNYILTSLEKEFLKSW